MSVSASPWAGQRKTVDVGQYIQPSKTGTIKKRLASKVALLKVPCVAKLGVSFLLKTFEMGANGVLIFECTDNNCIYSKAALWFKRRLEITRQILKELRPDQDLLKMICISGDRFRELEKEIDTFAQEIKL